jgi:uridine kinase
MDQVELMERLAHTARHTPRALVAVDGPDAAGKTTLADRLAARTGALRASIDAFHRPRAERYARGALSPEGYYRDSFDLAAFEAVCARPFLDGAPAVRTALFDFRGDTAVDAPAVDVPPRAVLIVDGVFLLRPELAPLWTLSVYLRVSPEESLRRALVRDAALMGSTQEVRRRYAARYLPGQALYRAEADPEARADVVLDAGPLNDVVLV